jgi:Cu-Zn family superoxide dismutase
MNKFFIAFLFLLISCQNSPPQNVNAVAVIQPGNGYNARGNVLFEQDGAEVIIKVNISGLNSNSYHGFHIHEFGDIRSQDGKSAGGHYNPDDFPHALPPEKKRHAGSFGNLISDPNGNVDTTFTDDTFSISGHFNPVLGRSVVVHAKRDDGGQPTGNAGARIGFGVIGISKN